MNEDSLAHDCADVGLHQPLTNRPILCKSCLPRMSATIGGCVSGAHVAQIPQQIHEFVVAKQSYYSTTRRSCVALKLLHQCKYCLCVVTTVNQVACLHKYCARRRMPPPTSIGQVCEPQRRQRLACVAVHIRQ